MRSVTCWFYYLITLVYMVTLCYKIVSAKHAKLIGPFEVRGLLEKYPTVFFYANT